MIYDILKNTDKKIFSDEGTIASLQFRFGYKNNNMGILQYAKQSDINGSYLVLYGSMAWVDILGLKDKMLRNLNLREAVLIKTVKGPEWGVYSLFDPQILYVK